LDQPLAVALEYSEATEGTGTVEGATALVAGGFSSVVDKGTLDAMLCEGLGGNDDDYDGNGGNGGDGSSSGTSASASAALLVNAARLLAPGSGQMVLVSLHPPQLVANLLAVDALGFDSTTLRVHVLPSRATAAAASGSITVELMEATRLVSEPTERQTPSAGGFDDHDFDYLPNALEPGEHTLAVIARSAVPWSELINHAPSPSSASPQPNLPPPPVPNTRATTAFLRLAVEAAHQTILDQWFREQQPLLTPQRQAALTSAWAGAAAAAVADDRATALPLPPRLSSPELAATPTQPLLLARLGLRAAYEAMFSADERAEYEFEDFLEDFQGGEQAREETNGESLSLSLADAIEFLRVNQ